MSNKSPSSSSAPPRILIDNVQVDHSNTVVHAAKQKKTVVPPWAQAKLKSRNGDASPTRTFKGGTVLTVTKGGGTATGGSTTISTGPQITNTAKRLAQPHDKPQIAPAPVAYVPEQRLFQKKLNDQDYLNKNTQKEEEETNKNKITSSEDNSSAKGTTTTTTTTKTTTTKEVATTTTTTTKKEATKTSSTESDDWWNQDSADLDLEAKILADLEIEC